MAVAQEKARLEIEKLQATQALEAEKARIELAMKAQALQNVPENADTTATVEQVKPPQVMPPIEINLNMNKPTKKIARINTDPITGQGVATIEEVPEEPTITAL